MAHYLTRKQFAKAIGVSEKTLLQWKKDGTLEPEVFDIEGLTDVYTKSQAMIFLAGAF